MQSVYFFIDVCDVCDVCDAFRRVVLQVDHVVPQDADWLIVLNV
jgi:hypothetical protein